MIVNLNLQDKKVLVIGGGKEALKRINSLLSEGCKITLISNDVNVEVEEVVKNNKIRFERQEVKSMEFFARYRPDLIMTTTDDHILNRKIISHAKKKKIIAYSSDSPELSDFANSSVVSVEDTIHIAVTTGGKSPMVAKNVKARIQKNIKKLVTCEDIDQVKIQKIARTLAKERIPDQKDRKAYLDGVRNDKEIKQLIKDGKLKNAESRAAAMLGNRKWNKK